MVAGLAAGLPLLAAPAAAATHRVKLPPEIRDFWVATKGGASECPGYPAAKALADCPRFRPVGKSGLVDMAGKLVYVARLANSEYRTAEYFVHPKHDVLPGGGPIVISIGK